MNISVAIDKLNNLSQSLSSSSCVVKFYNGQAVVKTSEIAKSTIPYGKVAVLYFKSQYTKLGKDFATMLKGNGNSVTHVVLPDVFDDTVENFSHLFNLAEDIRMVVTTDYRLYNVAKYFASIRGIQCVLVVDNLSCYGILNNNIFLSNGGFLERVKLPLDLHVVIDYNAILDNCENIADTYAFIVSHALALTDYRIFLTLKSIKPNKTAFSVAIDSITDDYALLKIDKEKRVVVLLNDLMSLELANLNTEGNIYQCFSGGIASYLLNGDLTDKGKNRLLCAIPIAKLYQLYLSGDYDNILNYPDYLECVDFICENINVNRQEAIDIFNQQTNLINSSSKTLKKLKQKISNDVLSFVDCSKNMINTFVALGGDEQIDKKLRDRAIKHSGNLTLNGMSLLRESGISQYL